MKSFLGADTVDEWRPKSLTCSWGDGGDSGPGDTGDAGGGYNAGDFSGGFDGGVSDGYSSNFDGGGGFDGGNQSFGGGFDGGGFQSSGSDNIGGDFSGTYGGGAGDYTGSFGTDGGWQDAVSGFQDAGPGMFGYMSGDMSAPGWNAGDYGAFGGFGNPGAFGGPGNPSGPFGPGDGGALPYAASPTGGELNGATIHGSANDYSGGLNALARGGDPANDLSAQLGINDIGQNLGQQQANTLTGNFANVYAGTPGHFNDTFGEFQGYQLGGNPNATVYAPGSMLDNTGVMTDRGLGQDPNDAQQAIDSALGRGHQQQDVGQQNNYSIEGKDQSRFGDPTPVGDLNSPFFASPGFGFGPMSTLAASQGAYLTDVGPGYFSGGANTAPNFDAAHNANFSPSEGNFNMAEAQAHGEQGRAGDNYNPDPGYDHGGGRGPSQVAQQDSFDSRFSFDPSAPITQYDVGMTLGRDNAAPFQLNGAEQYALTQGDLQHAPPALSGGNIGYDLGTGFAGRGAQMVASDRALSLNPDDNNYPVYDFNPSSRGLSFNDLYDAGPSFGRQAANNHPTLAEFLGPGRGLSQDMYAPSRSSPSLQVTVPGRTSQETPSTRSGGPFQGFQSRGDTRSQMDALLAASRNPNATQAGRIAALDALNGLISAQYGRGPNNSVGRGPYGGDPDPFIAAMLARGR